MGIREIREELGLTRKQVAKIAQDHCSTFCLPVSLTEHDIANLERPDRAPARTTLDRIALLARVYDIDLGEAVEGFVNPALRSDT